MGYYLERSRAEVRVVPDLLAAVDAEEPIQVMFGGARGEMEALVPRPRGGARRRGAHRAHRLPRDRRRAPRRARRLRWARRRRSRFLQERWGIAAAETLAIGDNWNDREMVERAGLGFVMGNADPELLALGLPSLPTNDEDGVAHAIEEHVLRA